MTRLAASEPIVLLHDGEHGAPLIDALARHGDGLPANVLPLAVNEVTQIGLEAIVAAFAYGAANVQFLLRAKPLHDMAGLSQTIAMADAILSGLGFAGRLVSTIETDDPDTFGETLRGIEPSTTVQRPATFRTVGKRRDLLRFALTELHRAAPTPTDVIALPEGAPLGAISVKVDGCTLCLSCVSVCPTGALRDDPERPALKFVEDACVQCGLCKSTCPEKVITLTPQIDFTAASGAHADHQGGRACALHPVQQAVRRQKHHRQDRRKTRRPTLDVSSERQTRSTRSECAPIAASLR